jgi:hypothetical protein
MKDIQPQYIDPEQAEEGEDDDCKMKHAMFFVLFCFRNLPNIVYKDLIDSFSSGDIRVLIMTLEHNTHCSKSVCFKVKLFVMKICLEKKCGADMTLSRLNRFMLQQVTNLTLW